MWLYQSKFLQLCMQIPDGWDVRMWPDDELEEFARRVASKEPAAAEKSCDSMLAPLMFASLHSPGECGWIDASIELHACDYSFLTTGEAETLTEWSVNGIPILYRDDFREGYQENMHYRFPRWEVGQGLYLYARILASGKERFDYVLSVFGTLASLDGAPPVQEKPLYDREPWNIKTSLYSLRKLIEEDRPLHDLVFDEEVSREIRDTNNAVLCGSASPQEWTPIRMRRNRRVLSMDCYRGPDAIYSSGVFSSRAVQLLRPYMRPYFSELECTVDGKVHYFLAPQKTDSCLDVENSLIKRFTDGNIMKIKRFRINRELVPDPLVFSIPEESRSIFATASIPAVVKEAGLKGIAFYPLDGNGRECTCPG